MKTKKISWQAIAIVVLALVLIASIALGVSGAWFQDNDSATANATMGDAVTIKLTGTDGVNAPQTWQMKYKSSPEGAFPGDMIIGATKIVPGSTAPMVLRYALSAKLYSSYTNETTNTPLNRETLDAAGKAEYDKLTEEFATKTKPAAKWSNTAGAASDGSEAAGFSDEKWCYYTEVVKAITPIDLFKEVIVPKDVQNPAAKWIIVIDIKVEAMQAANIMDGENPWHADIKAEGATSAIYNAINTYNTGRETAPAKP